MNSEAESRRVSKLRIFAAVAGVIALAGGLTALAGWMLGIQSLERFFPDQPAMKPNTSLGFILAGGSLWLLQARDSTGSFRNLRRRLGYLLAGAVCILGLVGFSEHLWNWGSEIDNLLVRGAALKAAGHANRIALTSALSLVFVGGGLLLLNVGTRQGRRPSEYLGAATFLAGMVGFLDLLFHPLVSSTGVALNSALLDWGLGCGLLSVHPDRGFMQLVVSRGLGGSITRRLLPAAVVTPIFFGWVTSLEHYRGLYGRDLAIMAMAMTSIVALIAAILWTAEPLDRADQERRAALLELSNRARQEAAIADLGQLALSNSDLPALMQEAVGVIARTLEVEFSKILELLPGGRGLLLRAGVGWKEGRVGSAIVDAESGSQAGYTLVAQQPVVVEDFRTERRFQAPPLLVEHGVVSGVSVGILGRERPFGVLGAHASRPRSFSRDDIHFLQAVANVLGAAIERQRAEEALRHANRYNRSLIEASLDPLVTISAGGKINDANLAAEQVTGHSRDELIGTDFFDYFTAPEKAREGYQRVFREGSVHDYELEIRHRDGQVTPVLYNASVYRDERGEIAGVFAAARDITERKRAEMELRRLNRALRTTSNCNQMLVRAQTEQELLDSVCKNLVEVGGFRMAWVGYAEQDEAKTVRPVAKAGVEEGYLAIAKFTWADDAAGQGPTGSAIRSGVPVVNRNSRSAAGFSPWREEALKRGYASSIALPLKAGPHPLGALMVYAGTPAAFDDEEVKLLTELAEDLGFGIDTIRTRAERKRAEEALRRQSGMNEAFFRQAVSCFVLLDPQYNFIRVNAAYAKACRRKVEDFPGHNHFEFYPSEAKFIFDEVVRTKKSFQAEAWPFTFPGQPERGVTYWDWTLVPILDEKREIEFLVFTQNEVTDRKRAEEALRFQAQILDQVHDSVVSTDLDGYVTSWNKGAERLFGHSAQEAFGKHISMIYEKNQQAFLEQQVIQPLKEKGSHEVEALMVKESGEQIYAHLGLSLLRDSRGVPIGMIGYSMDISERKRVEEELRRANEALRSEIAERRHAEQVLRGQSEVLTRALDLLVTEPDLNKFVAQMLCAISEVFQAHSSALWTYHSSTNTTTLDMTCYLEDGKCHTLEGERQLDHPNAWRPLPVSPASPLEAFYRSREPFIFTEVGNSSLLEEDVRLWASAQGLKCILSIPLVFGDEVTGVLTVRDTRRQEFTREEIRLAQVLGSQLTLALQLTRLVGQERESVVLQERNRMAREIHDSLAQGLTGVVIQLEAAEDAMSETPGEARDHLRRAKELARENLAEARRSVWALRPQILETGDLASALKRLLSHLSERTATKVDFSVSGEARLLSADTEDNLLRIGQEAVTNALKHAQAGRIGMTLAYGADGVELLVEDDGRGFDPNLRSLDRGLGLISMHERAQRIGAQLSVESEPGKGTRILAAVPLSPRDTAREASGDE